MRSLPVEFHGPFSAYPVPTPYCHSADDVLGRQHVPWLRGITDQHEHDQLVDIVLPYAHRAWQDLQKPDTGKIRFEHEQGHGKPLFVWIVGVMVR